MEDRTAGRCQCVECDPSRHGRIRRFLIFEPERRGRPFRREALTLGSAPLVIGSQWSCPFPSPGPRLSYRLSLSLSLSVPAAV